VNLHIQLVRCQFGNLELPHGHTVAQVAFSAELGLVLVSAVCVCLVEVHMCLCTSSMVADSLRCFFSK